MLGLQRPSVTTSYTIAIGAPEHMVAQARAAAGFTTLKIKLGFDGDLELAERLARELPGTTFRFDANEGWDRERAARSLDVLAALGAELVEQPLPAAATDDMLWLRDRTPLPLFADEAVLGVDELEDMAELYDGVVVKLQKAGGIAAAFALVSACTARGLRVLLGCMVESSLGVAAGLQLAGLADYVDLDGALLLAEDPFRGIEVDGDRLTASSAPGLGVTASRGSRGRSAARRAPDRSGAARRLRLGQLLQQRRAQARDALVAAGAVGHDGQHHTALALAHQAAVVRVAALPERRRRTCPRRRRRAAGSGRCRRGARSCPDSPR